MEDPKVEVTCEECGVAFYVMASRYEKAMENEEALLCDSCYAFFLDEQEKAARPKQRKFEYYIDEMEITRGRMNELGAVGWELITTRNDKAYFKREIIEEVQNAN